MYLENEIAGFYPAAVQAGFGAQAEYTEGLGWDGLVNEVQQGHGAMICLIKPGHFLAVVAYDDATQELIYNDSWPDRTGTDGFNLRMKAPEFLSNVKPYAVVFK
jgi:hypothetical protein